MRACAPAHRTGGSRRRCARGTRRRPNARLPPAGARSVLRRGLCSRAPYARDQPPRGDARAAPMPAGRRRCPAPAPHPRPRRAAELKKLRLLLIVAGLSSSRSSHRFGIMMAVAADLPDSRTGPSSSVPGTPCLRPQRPVLGDADQEQGPRSWSRTRSASRCKQAIVAIEDQRFYQNSGVDLRASGRALFQDVIEPARPGRFHDRPAVRQERARRPGTAHGLPEAPRGRARLPPHAQVVQGARSSPST